MFERVSLTTLAFQVLTAAAISYVFFVEIRAEELIVPHASYGVAPRHPSYDLKGNPYASRLLPIIMDWDLIQNDSNNPDKYDFSMLHDAIARANTTGSYIYLRFDDGATVPKWLLTEGKPADLKNREEEDGIIPMANLDPQHSDIYGYYLDPDYKKAYYALIEKLGDELAKIHNSRPQDLDRIRWIKVAPGSTGDPRPYRREGLVHPEFEIDRLAEWAPFSNAAIDKHIQEFQRRGFVVPVRLNADHLDAVITRKFNLLGHGYNSNRLGASKEWWKHSFDTHLTGETRIDSSCEFDLANCETTPAKLNPPLHLYWSALHALQGGLDYWLVREPAFTTYFGYGKYRSAEFFWRYAGDEFSDRARGAWCAFRKGLDSSDQEAFPADKYGKTVTTNSSRYERICQAYADYGARMEDPSGQTAGAVRTRGVKGWNDCVWDNDIGVSGGAELTINDYSRWLTLVNPEETVGWWRVGNVRRAKLDFSDNSERPQVIEHPKDSSGKIDYGLPYGRFARGFQFSKGMNRIKLDLKDSFFSNKPLNAAYPVILRVVYFDGAWNPKKLPEVNAGNGRGKWSLRYDANGDPDKEAIVITKTNSGKWKEVSVSVDDGYFANRAAGGQADLYLENEDEEDDIFHMVEIRRDLAFHDFDSGSRLNGAGWWYGGWETEFEFVELNRNRCARLKTSNNSRELARGFRPSRISFMWDGDRLEPGDSVSCEIRFNGLWRSIWTMNDPEVGTEAGNGFQEAVIDISEETSKVATHIRFTLNGNPKDDDFFIDDVLILGD